ncbi:hypothetical protein [Comamonas thiooxydans]|uniref:hypothetical protein n=1 Tax=Comamonas thiooxydans TaxID=363952 RepID=UPI0015A74A55|nr:hypothetical protein [Comamonas thiooxydans]
MIDKSYPSNSQDPVGDDLEAFVQKLEALEAQEAQAPEAPARGHVPPRLQEAAPPQDEEFKHFPHEFNERLSTDSADALRQLAKICHELARHSDYASVRNPLCQLSLELNNYALHAPGFRPRPRVRKSFGKSVCMQIHRDLGMTDLHWFFVRHERIRIDSGDALYQPLFDHDMPFDFELAWSFVKENWRNETKVSKALHLTEAQQYQSASLKSELVADRYKRLTVGKRENGKLQPGPLHQAVTALNKWCEDDDRVVPEFSTYEGIFTAYWLLGEGCKLSALAALTGLVLGQPPMNPRTLGCKLQKLLKRVEPCGALSGPSA